MTASNCYESRLQLAVKSAYCQPATTIESWSWQVASPSCHAPRGRPDLRARAALLVSEMAAARRPTLPSRRRERGRCPLSLTREKTVSPSFLRSRLARSVQDRRGSAFADHATSLRLWPRAG